MDLSFMPIGYVLLAIGGVALVFAIISAVVGEIFDAGFDALPDGVLSSTTLAATVAGFGFAGAAAAFGMPNPTFLAILGVAVLGAAVGWVLSFALHRLLSKQEQSDSATDISTLDGRIATVVAVPSTPGGFGTVVVPFLGQGQRMSFQSTDTFTVGESVVIKAVISNNQVTVVKHTA